MNDEVEENRAPTEFQHNTHICMRKKIHRSRSNFKTVLDSLLKLIEGRDGSDE